MLKVCFLGTGGTYSLTSLERLAEEHDVLFIGLVHRRPPFYWKSITKAALERFGLFSDPVMRFAASRRIPVVLLSSAQDIQVEKAFQKVRPDVICVAGFPWLLPRSVFSLPRLGCINAHPSLLPRHRGILPLFWIYYHDDRETGVTIHQIEEGADSGSIILQERFDLPRGFPVDSLNERNSQTAATLMVRALHLLEYGNAKLRRQEESQATAAPRIRKGQRYADLQNWSAERTWHFLAALERRYHEPIYDNGHRLARYSKVVGFTNCSHGCRAGDLERRGRSLFLYCKDGKVELSA